MAPVTVLVSKARGLASGLLAACALTSSGTVGTGVPAEPARAWHTAPASPCLSVLTWGLSSGSPMLLPRPWWHQAFLAQTAERPELGFVAKPPRWHIGVWWEVNAPLAPSPAAGVRQGSCLCLLSRERAGARGPRVRQGQLHRRTSAVCELREQLVSRPLPPASWGAAPVCPHTLPTRRAGRLSHGPGGRLGEAGLLLFLTDSDVRYPNSRHVEILSFLAAS